MSKKASTKTVGATAKTGGQTAPVTATAQAGQNNNQNTPADAAKAESKDVVKFTAEDKVVLQSQEKVIAANVGAFLAMGEALSIIKARDLQKITDPKLKFDDYCSTRWGFGHTYAYRLISAFECVNHLKATLAPNGVTVFPVNEAQVRPLSGLEKDEQVKFWSGVLQKANGGTITAAMVEEIVSGGAAKSAATARATDTKPADHKAEQRKLKAIAKLIEKAKQIDPAELNLKKLTEIIEKIAELLDE